MIGSNTIYISIISNRRGVQCFNRQIQSNLNGKNQQPEHHQMPVEHYILYLTVSEIERALILSFVLSFRFLKRRNALIKKLKKD